MPKKSLSKFMSGIKLKTVLQSMMLFMGLMFLSIQLYTVTNYSTLINESNAKLKSSVIKTLVWERLIHHHYQETLKAAEKMTRDPLFRNSLLAVDSPKIKRQLERALSNIAALSNGLDVFEVRALSIDYSPFAIWKSKKNMSVFLQKFPEHHQEMSDSKAPKISSHFFNSEDGSPVHMLVYPVGTTKTQGFLMLITSPVASLEGMGEFINAEIEVYNLAGQMIIADNPVWRNSDVTASQHPLGYTTMEIPISLDDGKPFLNVVVRYDNGAALSQYDRLNAFSILAVIAGFLISLYVVLYVLDISMFSRIQEISDTLVHIMQGRTDIKLPEVPNNELSVLWEQLEKIAAHEKDRNRLNYELVFALREAEVSNLAKAEFLTNMSHELRTPLNAIIGFSEIMTSSNLAGDLNDKYREYARDIRDSGFHLLNIINDILDLSKVEAGTVSLNIKEVIISEIIEKSVKQVVCSAKEKSILIENRTSERLPLLYLDEGLIHQIMFNILSNAVKFTPNSGNIVINSGQEKDGTICISITDNGIGIAEDQIGNVIMPFSQVNSSYTREHEGTGLGLALVKAFMELHGGRMYLESTWGVGTSVYLKFPSSCLVQETEKSHDIREDSIIMASQAN